MDERIYQIAEQIVEIHQKAHELYLPLVEDVCSRIVSEDELSHLLDYIKGCVEDICMYILAVLSFILKHIGRCGKMKTNDYLAEYI